MQLRKMRYDLDTQQLDEGRVHELVVIRDAQAHNALASQILLETDGELGLVLRLHDEDQLCPFQQLGRKRHFRVMAQAGGSAGDARMLGKDLLGRRAAPLVLATDEEDVGHLKESVTGKMQDCTAGRPELHPGKLSA